MASNLDLLVPVARRLSQSREQFVFVGGAIAGLLISDPAAPAVRPTDDVDLIIEIASYADYSTRLVPELHRLGLVEDMGSNVLCRWRLDGIQVDIMPSYSAPLGFSNRWYADAITHATYRKVGGVAIKVITAPYFVATKFEAFLGRARDDYLGSHDLEDIVNIVNGREELILEVTHCDGPLRAYLHDQVVSLLANPEFRNALPGHCEPGRENIVLDRLRSVGSIARP